ncbi:hypothetical protein EK904_010841 [Melospiza melodia maxima]|nr:hypothetical protein EK904_010841 [Melospiza melodia maxima]
MQEPFFHWRQATGIQVLANSPLSARLCTGVKCVSSVLSCWPPSVGLSLWIPRLRCRQSH